MGRPLSHTTPSRSSSHVMGAESARADLGDRQPGALAGGGAACYAGTVPRFEAFDGLRYDTSRVDLAQVVAPPYDVISPEERAVLAARSPYNAVRVELPDEEGGLDPYRAAAQRVDEWQAVGILRRDPAPAFYGYRMSYTDAGGHRRHSVGVIGALGLEAPGSGGIFPHERTTPKAKSDRLQLLEATNLNTSPIWVLSLATGLSELLDPPGALASVTDDEGTAHEMWVISDPAVVARVSEVVSSAAVVIADGHHRFETALTNQARRRQGGDGESGDGHDLVMALVVELVEDQLAVQAIHRLISGLPPGFDIAAALARHFDLEVTAAPDASLPERMDASGSLGLLLPEGTWLLHATAQTEAAAGQDLDSSRLEVALSDFPAHELRLEPGWDSAWAAVKSGAAQAAVLLRPVSVEQIASTGRGGERMPPKTTFFWPKPRTGFVFRDLGP